MMELSQMIVMLTDEDKERISKAMATKIEQEVERVDMQAIAENLLENVCIWINEYMEIDDIAKMIEAKVKKQIKGMLK
jgi:lysyl-tRNA synthetase class I